MSTPTVVILAVLVGAAMLAWRRGSWAMTVVLGLVAALPAVTLAKAMPWPVLAGAAVLVAVWGWHRWSRSASTVTRWGSRVRRKSGVASTLDITRIASGVAVKRRARIVRPSLTNLSRWEWWRLPAVEVGVRLCRVGLLSVWSSIEDVTVVFGGPRTGKTQWLAGGSSTPPARSWSPPRGRICSSCAARCGRRGGRCSCSTPSAWPTWRRRSRSTR